MIAKLIGHLSIEDDDGHRLRDACIVVVARTAEERRRLLAALGVGEDERACDQACEGVTRWMPDESRVRGNETGRNGAR